MLSLEERFWRHVDKSGECWLWIGAKYLNGYGVFCLERYPKQKNVPAHRVSWIIAHGSVDSEKEVCHTCDTRLCVRPNHLWLGTHKENFADAKKKGRLKQTLEHRQKIGAYHKGISLSEETKQKMRIASEWRWNRYHFADNFKYLSQKA